MNNKSTFEILNQEEFNADFSDSENYLNKLGGISDNNELGLGDWAYAFHVRVTNQHGEEKDFCVAFETEDRNNGMKAYSGYELSFSDGYGDQSEEIEEFCSDSEDILKELHSIAFHAAKEEFNRLIYSTMPRIKCGVIGK